MAARGAFNAHRRGTRNAAVTGCRQDRPIAARAPADFYYRNAVGVDFLADLVDIDTLTIDHRRAVGVEQRRLNVFVI